MHMTRCVSIPRLLAATVVLSLVPPDLSGQRTATTTSTFHKIQLATCPAGDTLRPSADDAAGGQVLGYFQENLDETHLQTEMHLPGAAARTQFDGITPWHVRWVDLSVLLPGTP